MPFLEGLLLSVKKWIKKDSIIDLMKFQDFFFSLLFPLLAVRSMGAITSPALLRV
jgi:hypothetical protein